MSARSRGEEDAHAFELLASVALSQEAEVANAVEAVWKRVQQKATDELVRLQAQDAGTTAAAIVFVGEGDFIVGDGDQSGIGDGRAMGVAGEIGQHALGSAERRLGVDDEEALPQGAYALGEDGRIGKPGQIPEEAEFAAMEGGFQGVEEQPAEEARQRPYGQEEVWLAGDPALAVEGDAAAGDKAVNVGMMGERLSPSVQNGDQADLGAEAFGGEDGERLGCRAHQQSIDDPLVLKGDLGRGRRQGEDDVKVGNRQQLGLARGEPVHPRR